jgi:phosphate transport system permease protein
MVMTEETFRPRLERRRLISRVMEWVFLAATLVGVVLLAILLLEIVRQGAPWLDWQFLWNFPSRFPERAGIKSALFGTVWLIGMTAMISVPIGVGAAIYLEEYRKGGRVSRFIEVNIANLAGVPSIVYGMLGLAIFVRWIALGRSVVAGAATMSLLILPIIVIASREALRGVPQTIRHAAFALGATQWQTIRAQVLPAAMPGILTGLILALSRAIGETAPLIMIGALTYVAFVPEGPLDAFTALPIQIYNWASRPQPAFHELAAAGILVLLVVLLSMNGLAVFLRNRLERKIRW